MRHNSSAYNAAFTALAIQIMHTYAACTALVHQVSTSANKAEQNGKKKLEKQESSYTQIYDETTVMPAQDEMYTEAPSSIFVTARVRKWILPEVG